MPEALPSVPPEYSSVLKVSLSAEVETVPESIWNLPLTPVRSPEAMKSLGLSAVSSLLPIAAVEETVSFSSDTEDVPVIVSPPVFSDPALKLVFLMTLFPVTSKALMSWKTAFTGAKLPPTVTVSRLLSVGGLEVSFVQRDRFVSTVRFSEPVEPEMLVD